MKTSISIGGRVLSVVVLHTDAGYAASFSDRFVGAAREFSATGETYEEALSALRSKMIEARIF